MRTGTIKFFNAQKGFGFVTADEGGADIFLPASSATDTGAPLRPGQRVEFEVAPDAKGPKISKLLLLEKLAANVVTAPKIATIYCDPSAELSAEILEEVHAEKFSAKIINYLETPLSHDSLRQLSSMLNASGQSLVRRFDPLFLALQLDDRFISEQEFWTAIVEHPDLINGPVIVLSNKARICKSAKDTEVFLRGGEKQVQEKPKTLSPKLVSLLRGEKIDFAAAPEKMEIKQDISLEKLKVEKPSRKIKKSVKEPVVAKRQKALPEKATKTKKVGTKKKALPAKKLRPVVQPPKRRKAK